MSTLLFDKQCELERQMRLTSQQRYHDVAVKNAQAGEATRSPHVRTVLDSSVVAVAKGIEEFGKEATKRLAGKHYLALPILNSLPASEIAFLAMKLVLDSLIASIPLTSLALKIGRELDLEISLRQFRLKQPTEFDKVSYFVDKNTSHAGHRRKVFSAALLHNNADRHTFPEPTLFRAGLKIIEIIIAKTGLLESTLVYSSPKKSRYYVRPTRRFLAWLDQLDMQTGLFAPAYWPTIIPPKPWTGLDDGGYWTDELPPLHFCKTRFQGHEKLLKKADLKQVFQAVNIIQETAWQINPFVLSVANDLVGRKHEIAGLPAWEDEELPQKPADIDNNEEAKKNWKRAAVKIYQSNVSMTSRRLLVLRILWLAKKFSGFKNIYFPYQTDFRGRIYAVPQTLNPQGVDLAKALLRFSDGEPLDDAEAVKWFLVHGANTFGIDKVSFDDRRRWVDDHKQKILQAASDPLDSLDFWAAADEPFCFLAWCKEFSEWQKNPDAFLSKIPIAMDGTCNGLQHYSALLRDPVGAKYTNLIPADKPNDIYGEVAKVVVKKLHLIAEKEGDQRSIQWLNFPIDRKITKRAVMVLPYGSTIRACRQYVFSAVMDKINEGVPSPFPQKEIMSAANYLANIVWAAIGEVVVGARIAMGWLQTVARQLSKHQKPVRWTSPSGFPVLQAYPKMEQTRIYTILNGNTFKPRMMTPQEGTIDARHQANAIAPNFVHSLDAAALILTVIAASKDGCTKYAMIHDSYATTARQAATLAKHLRSEFVKIYHKEILLNFLNETVPKNLRSEIPEPPFIGGFCLSDICRSKYFFS